jgi:hypothetical protein
MVQVVTQLSLELYLISGKSATEEELLLSQTTGDYFARLQNMIETVKLTSDG